MIYRNKKAFTLIEMLIVVVIIGILAAALIPRLQSVQARARDTKRKADLHQIGTALAIYKEDNGSYANFFKDIDGSAGDSSSLYGDTYPITDSTHAASAGYVIPANVIVLLGRYMTAVPLDPTISSSWVANSAPAPINPIYGYVVGFLPRRGTTLDSSILGARMESDGSSSNWVSNTATLNLGYDHITTGDQGVRYGSIGGALVATNEPFHSQAYDDNVCSKVTFDSSTTNDGQGTCTADKNADDLRYIYVQ